MHKNQISLDETDKAILRRLQINSKIPLEKIAIELGIPKSTVHYKTKRLEKEKVIEDYHVKVNPEKLGIDYTTVTFVRAKYGPSYHDRIGKMLALIPGVNSVYFMFGEYDFLVLIRSINREDFLKKLERMTNMEEIERTNTQVIGKTLKEDERIEI